MAEDSSDLIIGAESVVSIRSQAQLNGLSSIFIQTEELWMFVGCKLRQQADGKFVLLHNTFDRWIFR